MPLSEHEQRLLEQMERALYAEDPKLATTLRGGGLRGGGRSRLALGVVGVLAGLALLLTGVATAIPAIGAVGFVVLLLGGWLVLMAFRAGDEPEQATAARQGTPGSTAKPTAKKQTPPASGGGFMGRVEDRWKRRREDNDGDR